VGKKEQVPPRAVFLCRVPLCFFGDGRVDALNYSFIARPPAVLSHRAKSKTRAKALKDSQMSDQCSISMSMSICARPARPRRDTGAHCAVDAYTSPPICWVHRARSPSPPAPRPARPRAPYSRTHHKIAHTSFDGNSITEYIV